MPEVNVVINYEEIVKAIEQEILSVWQGLLDSGNKEIKNILGIEVSDEQAFVKKDKDKKLKDGFVYIVIRFGTGAMNFGSSVCPISLYCVGTANKVKPVQLLLGTFVSTYSTNYLVKLSIEEPNKVQLWNTPEVVTNFNEIDTNFRNLYRVVGYIILGPDAVRLGKMTYVFDEEAEEDVPGTGSVIVSILSFKDGYTASLDSQPFGNTFGFANSEVNFSTYTFSISTYLLNNQLTADMLAIRGFRNRTGAGLTSDMYPNKSVKVYLEFDNGFTNFPLVENVDDQIVVDRHLDDDDEAKGSEFYCWYKVVDSGIGQELGGIPTLTITFTR